MSRVAFSFRSIDVVGLDTGVDLNIDNKIYHDD